MTNNKALKKYKKEFLEVFHEKRRHTFITISILGITISPAFAFLDFFIAGDKIFSYILIARIFISIISLILFIIYKKFSSLVRSIDQFSTLPLYLATAHIAVIITFSGGTSSPYVVGEIIMLVLCGFYVYCSKTEGIILTLSITLSYIVSCILATLFFNSQFETSTFFTYTSVLLALSILTYHYLSTRYRLEEENFIKQRQIEDKNQQLLKLDQAKTRFFTNLTHEFRTPLVSLSTALQSISEQTRLEKDLSALLETSYASLNEMLENINDLLSKSKSEQGFLEMHWAKVDILPLIEQSIQIFQTMAHKKNLNLSFDNQINQNDYSLKFYADQFKLKKIIHNLLSNAIKYTHQGEIILKVYTHKHNLYVKIEDTGIGIPEEDLKTIFDPFTQASNNELRDVKGTGLGLSIVKDFVEAHGGKIHIKSEIGQGTCFRLEFLLGSSHIPKKQLYNPELSQEEIISSDTKIFKELPNTKLEKTLDSIDTDSIKKTNLPKNHLLLIDDNEQVLQALKYLLKNDYRLSCCQDGEEGMKKITELKPDLVISDIMMPKMNGYELVKNIKSNPELSSIPVILLTAKVDLGSKLQGFDAGADEYISKPFNNLEVQTRIKNLLARKKMEHDYIRAQEKMISLGQLVTGISHEILNPIAYAKSAAENIPNFFSAIKNAPSLQIEDQIKIEKDFAVAIDNVQDGIRRVSEIAEALRLLRRQSKQDLGFWDLKPGLEACLKIIQANFKANIDFRLNFRLQEKVYCNINQINQVFLNLLINAAHVIQNQSHANIWIETSFKQQKAQITIRDNGPGIPQETLDKIFSPFFTTKPVGQGTGLGLYISKQIIHDHDGKIFVTSQLGEGTKFVIELPLKNNLYSKNKIEPMIAFG